MENNLQDNIDRIEESIKDFKFLAANTANDELNFKCNKASNLLYDVKLQLIQLKEIIEIILKQSKQLEAKKLRNTQRFV
jgi:hypothetical protein